MEQWSEEQQQKAYQEHIQDLLEQFEIYVKGKLILKETERESACSFTEKLVARILDNLQVSIKNTYFRFEDSIVSNGKLENFSIGLKLKEFAIFTGDSDFKRLEQVIKDEDRHKNPLTYKVARIEGFSLFCDWENQDQNQYGGFDLEKLQSDPVRVCKEILTHEFEGKNTHHKNLFSNFTVTLQLQINKDIHNPLAPATLKFPQIKANLIIGDQAQSGCKIDIYQP